MNWDKLTTFLTNCFSTLEVITIDKLKVNVIFIQTARRIAEASMDFLLDEQNNKFTLYVDSKANAMRYNMLESLSEYLISKILKIGCFPKLSCNYERCLASLLKAENSEDIKQILMDMGIETANIAIDRDIDYNLNPRLGERIPAEWHHRLYADLLNTFRPQELIGYEERDNFFIFARVEFRVNQVSLLHRDKDEEMDMYVICISEEDDDSESKKTVPVIDLHKILRLKESEEENECLEIERHDSESETVKLWEMTKDMTLRDIYKTIYEELQRNNKISDPDLKRKCLKAMFLKWHPDKNKSPHATEAFRYLERQIDRLKRGLELEDPECINKESTNTYQHSNEWLHEWIVLARQRNESLRREGSRRRRNAGTSSGVAQDGFEITVSPDAAKAEVWLEQAKYDFNVMETVYEKSITDVTVSAHVCFLAHQVAEKSLKGGMYAKNGLRPTALKNHELTSHACALEQLASVHALGLSESARLLQSKDFYLKTRYPNRFGAEHKVPSLQYTQEEATEAYQAGKKIYNIVRTIV